MPSPWKASSLIKPDRVKQHNFLILFPRDVISLGIAVNESAEGSPVQWRGESLYLQRVRQSGAFLASTGRVQSLPPKERGVKAENSQYKLPVCSVT